MTFSSNSDNYQICAGAHKPYLSRWRFVWSKKPSLTAISLTTGGEDGALIFSLGIDRLFWIRLCWNGIWSDSSPFSEWGASFLMGSVILRWHQTTDTEWCDDRPLVINWKDWLWGECEYVCTLVNQATVSVQDGYQANVKIERVVGKRKRWFTPEEDVLMADIDLGETGIPYIRKGRDDILYSLRIRADSLEIATSELRKTLGLSA